MGLPIRHRRPLVTLIGVGVLVLLLSLGGLTAAANASHRSRSQATRKHASHSPKLVTGFPRRCTTNGRQHRSRTRRVMRARVSSSRSCTTTPEAPATTETPTAPEATPSPEPTPTPTPTPEEGASAPSSPEAPASSLEPEEAAQTPVTSTPSSIFWGAWLGRQLTGGEAPWDMSAVSKFEEMAGKKLSVLQFGSPFANCYSTCYFYGFPTEPMQRIREHGSIPFLSWSSQSIPTETSEPNYQLADVARGDYDSYIRSYARAAAAWGHPFFLRFDWEMNGNWFPWGAAANGNSAAEYVAAWRHVHDIFTSVGATNATWVWCPNVDPGHDKLSLSSLYPGNEYVDWTCLDGYNWGTNPTDPQGWATFDQLFRSTYNEIVNGIAPNKPMIIGETGSTEYGGSKANWITEALNEIPTKYPSIRGLLYFERYDSNMDWPIETSSSATSAFSSAIQNPVYASNTFGNLSTSGPIAPPGG